MISAAFLWRVLDYDPDTGEFCWKPRDDRKANWNNKMAGRPAGTHTHGYVGIRIDGQRFLAHRLAWIMVRGEIPGGWQIDHADMDPSNNRLANLRLATQSQNHANSIHKSASGVKGVTWRPDKGKWKARITINKKSFHLGHFDTAEEAHAVYLKRAHDAFGEFARGARR